MVQADKPHTKSHRCSKRTNVATILSLAGKIRQIVVIAANTDDRVRAELFRIFDQCFNDIFECIRTSTLVRLERRVRAARIGVGADFLLDGSRWDLVSPKKRNRFLRK